MSGDGAPWKADKRTARLAAELFDGAPAARSNGDQYLLTGTPFGRLELLRLPGGRGFLAAAERLPAGAAGLDPASLPQRIALHLERNDLRPWRVLPAVNGDVEEALRGLALGDAPQPAPREPGRVWSPFTCGLEEGGELIGEDRRQTAGRLAGLLAAREVGSPVPALIGSKGLGKRTAASAAASSLGLAGVELPLGRLLVDRVFQTPAETALETVLAAAAGLGESELLVVSGAETAASLAPASRRQLGSELSRLPRVLLLSAAPARLEETVGLRLPGLSSADEVLSLIQERHPDLTDVAGPVPGMLARAAEAPQAGIVPGRVLFLVRLALSLRRTEGARTGLSPDDVAPAVRLAVDGGTWEEGET